MPRPLVACLAAALASLAAPARPAAAQGAPGGGARADTVVLRAARLIDGTGAREP